MAISIPKPSSPEVIARQARAIRGRMGCDFWEKYVNAHRDIHCNHLAKWHGVSEANMTAVRAELYSILWDEGIRQDAK